MLTPEQVKKKIAEDPAVSKVEVTGDGYHFEASVVSPHFEGQSRLARQQWVYAKIKPWILSGELHAISIRTWTPLEWEKKGG